jgi:hypothetical protein
MTHKDRRTILSSIDRCASRALDDMNYDRRFRSLPAAIASSSYIVIIVLLLLSPWVNTRGESTKKSSDVLGDEKRVFDTNFGHNKNYGIDDCIPLAFGDFNADKIVDIFCRNGRGRLTNEQRQWTLARLGDSIRVMLNDDRSPTSKEQCRVNLA